METPIRPAYYALAPGSWRDYATVLHPPYTLWHLSFVALGAALSPTLFLDRLAGVLLAFFLAVGIGAHALDELKGRPLRTRIPGPVLIGAAVVSIGGAVAIGIIGGLTIDGWLLAFTAFGGFIVVAYNLELFAGRFHTDFWFAAVWGAFPVATGYWVNAGGFTPVAVAAAVVCFLVAAGQRVLSNTVRRVRRRPRAAQEADGVEGVRDVKAAIATPERVLQVLNVAVVLVAVVAIALRM